MGRSEENVTRNWEQYKDIQNIESELEILPWLSLVHLEFSHS